MIYILTKKRYTELFYRTENGIEISFSA
jgi:hypothetical protein